MIKKYKYAFLTNVLGNVSRKSLKDIDCYISSNMSILIPKNGFNIRLKEDEISHPGYVFIFYINKKSKEKENSYFCRAVSPGVKYHFNKNIKETRYIAVCISKMYFERIYKTYYSNISVYDYKEFYISKDIIRVINRFLDEYDDYKLNSNKILNCLAFIITSEIVKSLAEPKYGKKTTDLSYYDLETQVMDFLDNNYDKSINIPYLCEKFNVSKTKLYSKFQKAVGKTPMDYLNETRIRKAKKMLREKKNSIKEIALMCGFSSNSYFSAYFYKLNKMTPTEYRNQFFEELNS